MAWLKVDGSKIVRRFGRQYYGGIPCWPCVYALYNQEGELIYIGQTANLRTRIRQHRPRKLGFLKFKITHSPRVRTYLEARLIWRLLPRYNVAGTGVYQPRGSQFVKFSGRSW